MTRSRVCVSIVASVCMTGILAACGSSAKSSTASSPVSSSKVVTLASDLTLTTLDPSLSTDAEPLNMIYDPLVVANTAGKIVPDLASSWKISSNGSVWTFTLRSGVDFQNGSPVTPADVVSSIKRILADPKSPVTSFVSGIQSVTAVGSNQVQLTLKAPNVNLLGDLMFVYIVPQSVYTKLGAQGFAAHPVGSGPYSVVSTVPGLSVTLKANPHYWAGAPKIQNVLYESISSETTRISGLESGSINVTTLTPVGTKSVKSSSAKVAFKSVSGDGVTYLAFNGGQAPTNNLDFRKAVTYAINRPQITSAILSGQAVPWGQMLAQPTYGYDPSIPATPYDLAKAKQYLSESGYSGQTVPLEYPVGSYVPQADQIVQVIGAELNAIGIKVKIVGLTFSGFLTDFFAKTLSGISLFKFTGLNGPGTYSLLNSTATFSDSTVSSLFTEQAAQTNVTKQLKELSAIDQRYNTMAYYAPLFTDLISYAFTSGVTGVPRADGFLDAYDMSIP